MMTDYAILVDPGKLVDETGILIIYVGKGHGKSGQTEKQLQQCHIDALNSMLEIMRDKTASTEVRLAAARFVKEWTEEEEPHA